MLYFKYIYLHSYLIDMDTIWLPRSAEWIKDNPGKGTLYKVDKNTLTPVDTKEPEKIKSKFQPDFKSNVKTYFIPKLKHSGTYAIICDKAKYVYVGQSQNVKTRLRAHKMAIISPLTKLSTYTLMKEHWKQFGIKSFQFVECQKIEDTKDLLEAEINTMVEFLTKGYRLYNKQLPIGEFAIYCPKDIILTIQKTILMCKDKDFLQKIEALIS